MTWLVDTLSWGLLLIGGLFCVLSGIGLFRMPDLFTRSHAAGMTDTVGIGSCSIPISLPKCGCLSYGVRHHQSPAEVHAAV